MKKYFKPLDWWIFIPIIGIIYWTLLFTVFSKEEHLFPKWMEIILYVFCWIGLLSYVKRERIQINFDWILNVIYSKKLAELHKKNITSFYYCDLHVKYDEDFYVQETSLFQSYQITRVCTRYVNNKIKFCIELKRPGYLIGKRGRNIEKIQKKLFLDIYIIESKDIWRSKNNIF